VTTEAFGAAVLFRIDQPQMAATKETLQSARWIGDIYAGIGSEIEHTEIEPSSVLVGAGSIYRIIPCDEATARLAIRQEQRRPLMVVSLVSVAKSLPSADAFVDPGEDYDDDDESRRNGGDR
jgi:hypothetical protein